MLNPSQLAALRQIANQPVYLKDGLLPDAGPSVQDAQGVLLSPQRLDQVTLARRERRVPLVLLGERDYEVPADHVLAHLRHRKRSTS